jgi:glycosyltransferase involved in cell wall biosynthesis
MSQEPLVSVVTPFYNTAEYLAECMESVLRQTYANFEYLLLNNRSTDGSREIAARYAKSDPRIRLLDTPQHLDQLPNFNHALRQINPASAYVKMVLADDAIAPDCLERMVATAQLDPRIAIVAGYYSYEGRIDGAGIPLHRRHLSGRDALRLTFLMERFLVGSPSTVLYRADAVRRRDPFFTPGLYHADTETAYEIMLEADLGFVHQVVAFVRADNEGITSSARAFYPVPLDHLIVVERFGSRVLSEEEYAAVHRRVAREYYALLGRMALRLKGRAFWRYHRRGLGTLGRTLRWWQVVPWSAAEILHVLLNPEEAVRRLLARGERQRARARRDELQRQLSGTRAEIWPGDGGLAATEGTRQGMAAKSLGA